MQRLGSGWGIAYVPKQSYRVRKQQLIAVNECLCLHAEENALLEAGKDRIGEDSVIYCNTYVGGSWLKTPSLIHRCPCLRCSVKIVQCGVREVVYNQSYSMDEASARVLKEAGVILRQLHLPADMKAALL